MFMYRKYILYCQCSQCTRSGLLRFLKFDALLSALNQHLFVNLCKNTILVLSQKSLFTWNILVLFSILRSEKFPHAKYFVTETELALMFLNAVASVCMYFKFEIQKTEILTQLFYVLQMNFN